MKTKIKAVLFALFSAVMVAVPDGIAVASDAEGQYTVYGRGNDSCAKFLKEDKEDNIASKFTNIWISGFMSAAGLYNDTQKPFDNVTDFYGIEHLIREYCEKNPLNKLEGATQDVVQQLIKKDTHQRIIQELKLNELEADKNTIQ